MELRNIELGDLSLYEQIHCDPAMMEHLGGPLPSEGLAEKLERDVATAEADESWVLKIVPDPGSGLAAGTVCIWPRTWESSTINEIGWMVLPAFQGQGVGSAAVRAALDRARSESRWDVVHAFPPVANPRSNGMCRTFGFEHVGDDDYEFRDRLLRCSHWQLDLR